MSTQFKKILVVEDGLFIGEALGEILTDLGYEVVLALDGAQGLDLALAGDFDLVISDIQMPGMSGLEVFEIISVEKKIPVILMTGQTENVDMKKAYALGVSEFLAKPFTRDDIIGAIKAVEHETYIATLPPEELIENKTFARVSIQEYVEGAELPYDIYVKIGEQKHVRVAKKETPLESRRIQNYQGKGEEYFYVKQEDFNRYASCNINLAPKVPSAHTASKRQKLALAQHSTEVSLPNAYLPELDLQKFCDARVVVESALKLAIDSDELSLQLENLRSKDARTYNESVATAVYSVMIAEAWGWRASSTLLNVALAGLFHDIGKVELPSELLKKDPASMTAEERALYETHPELGRDILANIPGVAEEIIEAAMQHHENIAGTGFPKRTNKIRLHPVARIVLTVNAFCSRVFSRDEASRLSPVDTLQHMYLVQRDEIDLGSLKALLISFSLETPAELDKINFNHTADLVV